jgi:monovalent cation:H+ antiporter, CPA1 family
MFLIKIYGNSLIRRMVLELELIQLIILLLIGYIVFTIDTKQENFPVPTVLLLIGMGLSFLSFFGSIKVTENMIYHIFIPALLFISAYQFPISGFKKNKQLITLLATVGIVLTVLLLGSITWGISLLFMPLSFVSALVIAAILTPTDPVSVVSIIKKATGNEQLANTVEGESMLNDGTSIVVYTSLAALLQKSTSFHITDFFVDFAITSIGGITVGLICGFLVTKMIHYSHHRQYQLMLSIILAYGSFMLAEQIHVSGVLAVVASGMMISKAYGNSEKEDHFRASLDGFWEIIEVSLLALLFLLIGIEITEYLQVSYFVFGLCIFICTIIVRFIVIYLMSSIVQKHDYRYNLLMSWAGLKGSMSVFLILSLSATNGSSDVTDKIVGICFSVVILSLIVQSLTISPLAKKVLK